MGVERTVAWICGIQHVGNRSVPRLYGRNYPEPLWDEVTAWKQKYLHHGRELAELERRNEAAFIGGGEDRLPNTSKVGA